MTSTSSRWPTKTYRRNIQKCAEICKWIGILIKNKN